MPIPLTLQLGLRWLVVVGVLGWLAPSAAQAEKAPPCGALRLSLLTYPGIFEIDAKGNASGFEAELAKELATRSGCQIDIVPTNTARLWPAIKNGLTDLTGGAAYLPERRLEADFLWIEHARVLVLMQAITAQANPDQASFDSEPDKLLGIVRSARRGPQAQAWVDKLRARGRVRESADMPALLRAFEAGRVHAVLIYPGAVVKKGEPWLAAHTLKDWMPKDRFSSGWAVSRITVPEPHRRQLREAAEALRADGTLMRILRKNLGESVSHYYDFQPAPPELEREPAAKP